ncbi:MAG: mannosylglycerate synthase domain-containing protein [Acidimicrobiia bacterium]
MSLVVFPFKSEPAGLIVSNLATAAAHPATDEVWAMASAEGRTEREIRAAAPGLAVTHGKPVEVLVQERLGTFRPGKGDGMNTAIALAAEQGRERVHFYDADITNFDKSWIDGAEAAADRGFGVVRHRFPRAATDAMITWMITRPALARLFPGPFLPRLNQPLGGEILLTRPALEALAASQLVRDRSDWGIDTALTYSTSVMGLDLYEHHVADGKRHALYGSLDELRDMLVECLDAAVSLRGKPPPPAGSIHGSDSPAPAPPDLKRTVAYDIEATLHLLATPWAEEEAMLARMLPGDIGDHLNAGHGEPGYSFMDEGRWHQAHGFLLDGFVLGDPAWESLAFRLWLTRVLAYTTQQARYGYDEAMAYLEATIAEYEHMSISAPGST